MRLMSKVCAEFHDAFGTILYKISPADLYIYQDVPDIIVQDPLFGMLLHDDSILLANSDDLQRLAENDPRLAFRLAEEAKKPDSPENSEEPEKPEKQEKPAKAGKADSNVPAAAPAAAASQPDGGKSGGKKG